MDRPSCTRWEREGLKPELCSAGRRGGTPYLPRPAAGAGGSTDAVALEDVRCPRWAKPRRYLYGVALIGGRQVDDGVWRCHRCAGLLFAAHGHYQGQLWREMFTACYG